MVVLRYCYDYGVDLKFVIEAGIGRLRHRWMRMMEIVDGDGVGLEF